MHCPSCNAALPDGAPECRSCGIVLAKWKSRQAAPQRTSPGTLPKPPAPPSTPRISIVRIAILAIVGTVVVVGGYWMYRTRSYKRLTSISSVMAGREKKLAEAPIPPRDYDRAFVFPGSPSGMVSDGPTLLVANRNAPGGIVRIRRDGDDLRGRAIPIIEEGYGQQVSVGPIAFDGTHVVGYTTGSWFGLTGDVFTIHDAKTLAIIDKRPAPPLIGGLAFDGTHWWAATRRNTEDSGEPAFLYKLNREFEVVSKTAPPAVGCQGLAWDGRYLWFVDVFSDSIAILDVASDPPRVVRKESAPFGYLSGVASFDGEMWVCEYGDNRIIRIQPSVRSAWAGGGGGAQVASAVTADVAALTEKLKSGDVFDRIEAEAKLNAANAPVLFDRDSNTVTRGAEEAELIEWSAEIRDGSVYASWRLWFGDALFVENEPSQQMLTIPRFAKYTVTFDPPAGDAVEKEYTASPGENVMNDVFLGAASAPGDYSIEMFLHVQYVAADGMQKILNRSTIPLHLRTTGR